MLESLFNKIAGLKASTQVFSREYHEIFKNGFYRKSLSAASVNFFRKIGRVLVHMHELIRCFYLVFQKEIEAVVDFRWQIIS